MSSIWVVTVRERSGQATQLCFSSEPDDPLFRDDWWKVDRIVKFEDDFGTRLRVRGSEIAAVMMQYLPEVAEGQPEVTLFQSRAQVRLQEKADADPVLKAHAAKVRYAQAQQAGQAMVPWPVGKG
jgi:hypothetical protein